MDDCLKLTVYVGERERADGELVTDALFDLYERHDVRVAALLRGIEGFGVTHAVRDHRLLTLSEDLPLVSIALAPTATIEALLPDVERLVTKGLVTLERSRLLHGAAAAELPVELGDTVKLTVFVGRKARTEGRAAYRAIVDLLHARGVSGATVFLAVDGVLHGERQRARFLSRNVDVPLVLVSVGARETLVPVLGDLRGLVESPLATVERVELLKRGGQVVALPGPFPDADGQGLDLWRKLTVFADEQAQHGGHPLYLELVRRLREAGAAGTTVVRGIWGYSADHGPHGDRLLSLRRHVPIATVVIDRPGAMQAWWPLIDELTADAGLVTNETVPAYRAVAPGIEVGGLRLARRPG